MKTSSKMVIQISHLEFAQLLRNDFLLNCDPRFAREVPDRDSIDNKLRNSEKKDVQIYKKIIGQISNRMQYFAILIKAESIKIKHFDEIGGSGQAHFGPSGPEARQSRPWGDGMGSVKSIDYNSWIGKGNSLKYKHCHETMPIRADCINGHHSYNVVHYSN